jgi:DNA-binding response OmpR family regulator
MRVLVIEDEKRVAEFICKGLRVEGFFCEQANDGQSGLGLAKSQDFDVIVLDRMLPDIDGISVLKQIRQLGIATPILFLTALDDVEEKVHGLRSGGDDYLTKPFDFEELLARIEVLARRSGSAATEAEEVLRLRNISINLTHRSVHRDNELIKLTALEYDLLRYLAKSGGRVLSRERILNNVWQMNSDPLTNVVDVYINRLRKKLDNEPHDSLIETLRGVGYRLQVRSDG